MDGFNPPQESFLLTVEKEQTWETYAHYFWFRNQYNWRYLVKPYEFVGQVYKRLYA